MRILLTILCVLGISLATHASNTRIQSLPLASDEDTHRALTDQVTKVVMNIWTQVLGDVDANGTPLWRMQGADSGSFLFSVDNGEIDYEFLRDQFTQFIDRNLETDETSVGTVRFSTRMHLWSADEVMFAFANEFYLERSVYGDLEIPETAYQVEFNEPQGLYIPEAGVESMRVVYDMLGEEVEAYDSQESNLVRNGLVVIPLDAQREARQFGIPGRVILTYFDGEVREFDLDTGLRIGDPSTESEYSLSLEVVDGNMQLDIVGPAGSDMRIECSQDLVNWVYLDFLTIGEEGSATLIDDPTARGLDRCFYRATPY